MAAASLCSVGDWSDFDTWEGGSLRRQVFFFRSGGVRLYGSFYEGAARSSPLGVVACGSWGVEADRSDPLVRSVALAAAALGGAALVFHYPGYGDSYGNLAGVGFDDLVVAARDAVAEASRRRPGTTWTLAGFMLGAAVACFARPRAGPGALLLVQPALRPGAYFERLRRRRRPLALAPGRHARRELTAGGAEGMAYGYPLPARILDRAPELDAAAELAMEVPAPSGGDGATVVRYAEPAGAEPLPNRFRLIEVPGRWAFGSSEDPPLAEAVAAWLGEHAREGAR